MKKTYIYFVAVILFLAGFQTTKALTTLVPGDLVVVTANSQSTYAPTACALGTSSLNSFEVLTRVAIDAGTQINFADEGWNDNGGANTWRVGTEGAIRYTAPSALAAGSIIYFTDCFIIDQPTIWKMDSIPFGNNIIDQSDYSTAGDNILIFQGGDAAPSFIYGFGFSVLSPWISTGAPTTNNSYVPSTLSLGTTAVTPGTALDNVQYKCTNLGIYSSTFLTSFNLAANWNGRNTPIYGAAGCAFDVTRPSVTINQAVGQADPTNGNTINFTAVFSEAINPATFASADLVLSGTGTGTVGTPTTANNITWNIPVTATGDGTFILNMAAGLITDINGNPNTISTSTDNTVTRDTVVPTISLVTPIINSLNVNSYSPSGTCSANGDSITVSIGGASPGAAIVSCSGGAFNAGPFDLSALPDGIVTVTAVITDLATNSANTSNSPIKDTIGITATVEQAVGQVDPTNGSSINFTVTFSEAINGATFVSGDLVLTGTGTGIVGTPTTLDNITWNVLVTATTDGTFTLNLPAGTVEEANGNLNSASTSTDNTVLRDTLVPTINLMTANINSVNVAAYSVNGTCSDNGDSITVSIAGATPSLLSTVCSGGTFSVGIFDLTALPEGPVTVTAVIMDLATNSANTSNTPNKDTTGFAVSVEQAVGQVDPTSGSSINFTVTFSEAANPLTFGLGELVLSGTGTGTVGLPTTVDNITWDVVVSATTDGTFILNLPAGLVEEMSGNTNNASVSIDNTVTRDTAVPTITLITPNIDATNVANYSPTGTCSDNGDNIIVSIAGAAPPSSVVLCAASAFTAGPFDLSGLPNGSVNISAVITDLALNSATVSNTPNKNIAGPVTPTPVISSGAGGPFGRGPSSGGIAFVPGTGTVNPPPAPPVKECPILSFNRNSEGAIQQIIFNDIDSNNKQYKYLADLVEQNIVNGRGDGHFAELGESMLRSEAAKVVAIARGTSVLTGECAVQSFIDVPMESWFYPYIEGLKQDGVVSGYGESLYKPNQSVNFGETLKLINVGLNIFEENNSGTMDFLNKSDAEKNSLYLENLEKMKIISAKISEYNFSDKMTRGDFMELISNALSNIDSKK